MLPPSRNRLLTALPEGARADLFAALTAVKLEANQTIETPGRPVSHLYFVESGLISLVAVNGDHSVDVGLIGWEGVTGLSLLLGAPAALDAARVHSPGEAFRISAGDCRAAMNALPAFEQMLLRYAHNILAQVSQTALWAASVPIGRRLGRLILMASDRLGEELVMTHEKAALMLGVRRPSVTMALHVLEGRGFVRARRNRIAVIDRAGLVSFTGIAYGGPERAYDQLLGAA